MCCFVGAFSQNNTATFETYPMFPSCEGTPLALQPDCFNARMISFVLDNFQEPERIAQEQYEGEMILFFEVTKEGVFKLLNVNAAFPEVKTEAKTLFEKLPAIKPATFNGEVTYKQFTMPVKLPLSRNTAGVSGDAFAKAQSQQPNPMKLEYDRIVKEKFDRYQKYTSQLTIPFSHQVYSRFDQQLNLLGTNAHTASKPYLYGEVQPYYDFEAVEKSQQKDLRGWWGRKFFNEHMITVQGDNYWFTVDPGADLQLGTETDDESDYDFTYNNTRALIIQGGLGKKLNFYTSFFESQGRFAEYFNDVARSIRPAGGNPGIVPARDIGKPTRAAGGFDYPVAEAYVSFTPSKYFNLQLGTGKNFIGDGYRSLFQGDGGSPYPFFKLNTKFWKIKYTNTFTSLRDVRAEVVTTGSYRTKYMASHYLSYNVSKRLNIGFFEAAIWEDDNGQGFDVSYLNPVIFYQAVQFTQGSRGGNSLIGLSGKYKWSDNLTLYGQWIIDEFSGKDVFGFNESYKNKLGFQLGAKYYDAFNVDGLILQGEINQVRPYVYSNNEIQLNYGHKNQSLAHQWGANFREFILIGRYQKDRWYGTTKVIYGKRGFEIGDIDQIYYGGSIYGNDENRPNDNENAFFQGNEASSFYAEAEIGYLINPATNLKAYIQPIYRDIQFDVQTEENFDRSTFWFNVGFRTDVFNWYYDY